MDNSQNTKIYFPYNSAIPFLDIYPKGLKTLFRKDISMPMFIAELFTTAQLWKQPMCPRTDEQIKKNYGTYNYDSIERREKIMKFAVIG